MHRQLFLLSISKEKWHFSSKSCMLWHLCTNCWIFIRKLLVHGICVRNFVMLTDSQNWFVCLFIYLFLELSVAKQMFPSLLPITWTRRHSQKPCCQTANSVARSGDFPDAVDDLNCQKWLATNLALLWSSGTDTEIFQRQADVKARPQFRPLNEQWMLPQSLPTLEALGRSVSLSGGSTNLEPQPQHSGAAKWIKCAQAGYIKLSLFD